MKLTIITINLNNANGLKKTIESVINQTSTDFEYIIIDGGSKDGSIDIIKSYTKIAQGSYIKPEFLSEKISYWISEPDSGIYSAMNKGIRVAKGKFCQFLNSGDYLTANDVTAKMLDNMPNCNILYGNMIKILPNGKKYIDKNLAGKEPTMLNLYKGTLNHSCTFIKRELFDKYGLYDESLKIVSDWKWYLKVLGFGNEKVSYLDIEVSYFNMNGISNKMYELNNAERRQVLNELIPVAILRDYDRYWFSLIQINRINKYWLTRKLFWIIERILFKLEKKHLIK